jgi:hypothetical protein
MSIAPFISTRIFIVGILDYLMLVLMRDNKFNSMSKISLIPH